MQYKMIQKTQWQAQKIGVSYKCFGQQYKDFVVFYIAFVFRPQLGFQLGFSKLYSKLSVVKYNVTVKFGTNCLELTPWKFTPFGFSPGSVVNYKLLRASHKSMESMEIIFHSADNVKYIKGPIALLHALRFRLLLSRYLATSTISKRKKMCHTYVHMYIKTVIYSKN